MTTTRFLQFTNAALAVALGVGCTHLERRTPGDGKAPPVIDPLALEASILSAVLDGDCQTARVKAAARSGSHAHDAIGVRACEQSNVQLLLRTSAGNLPARIELASVTVHDDKDGRELETLIARNPQLWQSTSSTYVPWDRTIAPSQELRTSFDLSAPDWDAIGGGNRWSTSGMSFRLTVRLRVDGKDRSLDYVLKSPFIAREPMMRT